MRKTERLTRRDWERCLSDLDGDTQAVLRDTLVQYEGGETCDVEFTVDSCGRIDSESSPRPAVD